MTFPDLVEVMARRIAAGPPGDAGPGDAGGAPCVVVSQNLHGVHTYFKVPAMRALHDVAHVRIDGTPIYWLARLAGLPARFDHRLAWIDMFWPLMGIAAERGWRVYYVGAKPAVLEEGLRRVREALPGLAMAGHHGYFDKAPGGAETGRVLDAIRAFAPDVVIVGLGMPAQETWVLENRARLAAPVVMTSGACIEFVAGYAPTPPRWLGRFGLEWTYRLATRPRRFAWRYLVEPLFVAGLIGRHLATAAVQRLASRAGSRP